MMTCSLFIARVWSRAIKHTGVFGFILADDLGYGDIGPFGQKIIHTPTLDHLARGDMKLTGPGSRKPPTDIQLLLLPAEKGI